MGPCHLKFQGVDFSLIPTFSSRPRCFLACSSITPISAMETSHGFPWTCAPGISLPSYYNNVHHVGLRTNANMTLSSLIISTMNFFPNKSFLYRNQEILNKIKRKVKRVFIPVQHRFANWEMQVLSETKKMFYQWIERLGF